jgi:hypothetical protein
VNIDGNTAAIVDDGDRLVGVYRDGNFLAIARERFVDGVVDDFEDHVVEPGAVIGVTDVHSRPFSDRLETF